MIALTDSAVKTMLQARFNMPAIFSSESTALEERGDIRFQLPTGLIQPDGTISPKVKFPFCIWMRDTGSLDEERFNLSLAREGVDIGFRSEDGTKAKYLKIIPVKYPYSIKYFVSEISQAIRMEKIYWGLKVEFLLSVYYPIRADDRLKELKVCIAGLSGFGAPKTDTIYSKGKYFVGNMDFSVNTWVIEGVDIPIVQEILINTYDQSTLDLLDSYSDDEKTWR